MPPLLLEGMSLHYLLRIKGEVAEAAPHTKPSWICPQRPEVKSLLAKFKTNKQPTGTHNRGLGVSRTNTAAPQLYHSPSSRISS